ncbi:unnamed protein product [Amoebophrya sp. A120]|nr:unnamed protein product [Amoebophrya sp. A120]|eukprot:GSA120T00005091001.1
MLCSAARVVCRKQNPNRAARELRSQHQQHRHMANASGVKLLDERGKASENIYFSQEDQRLMKKLLEQNPDIESKYGAGGAGESTEEKVKLVFLSHGIPPLNKNLINDLVGVLEEKR